MLWQCYLMRIKFQLVIAGTQEQIAFEILTLCPPAIYNSYENGSLFVALEYLRFFFLLLSQGFSL